MSTFDELKEEAKKTAPKQDSTKRRVFIEVTEADPLAEFCKAYGEAKVLKGQAEAKYSQARHLYNNARKVLEDYHGEAEAPESVVYKFRDGEIPITIMSGAYPALKDETEVKELVGEEFYKTHFGEHATISVNTSEVPKGKLSAVIKHLKLADVIAGSEDKPVRVVKVDFKSKAKSTFHDARRTELDSLTNSLLDEHQQTRVQFAPKKNG